MKKLLCLAPLAMALVVAGCSFNPDPGGTLVLSFLDRVNARTIEPGLDMNPATWDVLGTGPGGAAFSQTGLTSSSCVRKSLIPGEWLIEVTARNAGGVAIGYGSTRVTIEAGEVALASVTVRPLVGDGTLDVRVTWPEGVLTTPVLSADLAPSGSAFAALPVSPGPNSAALLGDHPNGYYSLRLLLSDEGSLVWGAVEAVRIIAGETSAALFALTNDVNRGGLALQILTDLQNPITVSLAAQTSLQQGSTMTVTASTSDAVDSYQWYLQGAPVGTNASSISIGSGLGLGHYWLSLVVTKGSILSSKSVEFDVVPAVIRNYELTLNVQSGSYAGAVYHGSFSVDESALTGVGVEVVPNGMRNFMFYPFGGSYGPANGGDVIYLNGVIDKINHTGTVNGRGWGFNIGFEDYQVPPDILGGRWWGYLDVYTFVEGFGVYTLTQVP